MTTIALPRIVGTRREVSSHVRELGDDLRGSDVLLDCTALLSALPSFADEIVDVALTQRRADHLVVVGAGPEFIADVCAAAEVRGLADRLVVLRAGAAAAVT